MKIPYIHVNNIEEYFALPKKERTWYGFYKSPLTLPLEFEQNFGMGWDRFYQEIKKEFPVQWFFRHWLFSLDNPLTFCIYRYVIWPYRNFKNSLHNFLNPCYPRWRKLLPRTKYADPCYLITESNFAILKDFYYEEVLSSSVDWDSSEDLKTFRNDMEKHIHWLEVEKDKIDQEINKLTLEAYTGKTPKDKFQILFKKITDLEFKKEKTIDKILKWMITNREYFWT